MSLARQNRLAEAEVECRAAVDIDPRLAAVAAAPGDAQVRANRAQVEAAARR